MKVLYWSPDNGASVRLEDKAKPTRQPTEVLIRATAFGLTLHPNDSQGFGACWEVAGMVVEAPKNCRLSVGESVFGLVPATGSQLAAEYVSVDPVYLVPIAHHVGSRVAAAVAGSGLRALTSLVPLGGLVRGDTVLIVGAAGESGHLAVQLAAHFGMKVLAVAANQKEAAALVSLPIERVIELPGDSVVAVCREETRGMGVDGVYDADGIVGCVDDTQYPVTVNDVLTVLGPHSTWVTAGLGLELDSAATCILRTKNARVAFVNEQTWALAPTQHGKYLHLMHHLARLLEDGTLKPHMAKTLTPAAICAQNALSSLRGSLYGKIVIAMDEH